MERDANKLKERMQKLVIEKGSNGIGAFGAGQAYGRSRTGAASAPAGTEYINESPLPPVRTGGLWKHGTERNENAFY